MLIDITLYLFTIFKIHDLRCSELKLADIQDNKVKIGILQHINLYLIGLVHLAVLILDTLCTTNEKINNAR